LEISLSVALAVRFLEASSSHIDHYLQVNFGIASEATAVEYNSDPDYHINLKRETENVKTQAKWKGGAAALRAQSAAVATPGDVTDPPTPHSKGDSGVEPRRGPPAAAEDEKPVSPASSTSSGSEPPLAQRVRPLPILKFTSKIASTVNKSILVSMDRVRN
jgi:hypothetical protein